MTVELAAVTTVSSNAFDICAARSNGALTASRLRSVIKGSSPVGEERFCFMQVLGHSAREHRVEMALSANMSWEKFAQRFEELTGINRNRAHFATTLYSVPDENVSEYVDDRMIA